MCKDYIFPGNYKFPAAVVEDIGDPFVLTASDGFYYMYGTSHVEQRGYHVWKSSDLENWSLEGRSFINPENSWVYKDFWAPEVIEYKNKYYMFYTAREIERDILQIGLAVSDQPTGPFIDEKQRPILDVDYAVIDASILIDDGKIYLYYSRDCSVNVVDDSHRSDIYVVELDENFNQKGEPIFLFAPTQEWETIPVSDGWLWNEGASVIKVGEFYYMTYSGNPFWSFDYAVGLATSTSPMGPFEKDENNPVLRGCVQQKVSGTGHNSIFTSHDGARTYIAYHVHKDIEVRGGDRNAIISEVKFENKRMKLI